MMNPITLPPQEIATLLDKINPHSPVRRIAETLLSGTYDPLSGVDPLFTTLTASSGRPWRERVVAAWALGRVPLSPQERAAATDMLMDALERDRHHSFWSTFRSGLIGGYGTCLAFGFLAVAITILTANHRHYNLIEVFLEFAAVAALVTSPAILASSAAMAWHLSRKHNSLRAAAAESLGRLAAPEALGALAGALFDNSARVREATATALHAVLPSITEEHDGLLGAASMIALGRALKHDDTLLVRKLLTTLGKIGTSHALPYVKQAAEDSRMTRVRDAARDTLEIMQERQLREKEAQTLIRPSYAIPSTPVELLRPAHGNTSDDPFQLLRAVDGE
jgi:hypothetical protein